MDVGHHVLHRRLAADRHHLDEARPLAGGGALHELLERRGHPGAVVLQLALRPPRREPRAPLLALVPVLVGALAVRPRAVGLDLPHRRHLQRQLAPRLLVGLVAGLVAVLVHRAVTLAVVLLGRAAHRPELRVDVLILVRAARARVEGGDGEARGELAEARVERLAVAPEERLARQVVARVPPLLAHAAPPGAALAAALGSSAAAAEPAASPLRSLSRSCCCCCCALHR